MSEIVALASYDRDPNPLFLNEKMHTPLLQLHAGYRTARANLTLVRSILALIACIQRHRGATMALLGGDDRFSERMASLQKEIALRIDLLMLEPEGAIDTVDRDHMIGAWKTIAHNWQDDAVLENFEYHSHLIERLMRIVRAKGDVTVERLNDFSEHLNDPVAIKNLTIVNCLVCNSIPDCFELLAKLRGLATHAAASHQCDSMTKSRIEFSLKEFGRLTAKMDHQINELEGPIHVNLVPGNELAQAKVKRDYLTHLLSNDIVEGVRITLDSEMVYRVTTEVIDTYYAFSESILSYMDAQLPKIVNRCVIAMA